MWVLFWNLCPNYHWLMSGNKPYAHRHQQASQRKYEFEIQITWTDAPLGILIKHVSLTLQDFDAIFPPLSILTFNLVIKVNFDLGEHGWIQDIMKASTPPPSLVGIILTPFFSVSETPGSVGSSSPPCGIMLAGAQYNGGRYRIRLQTACVHLQIYAEVHSSLLVIRMTVTTHLWPLSSSKLFTSRPSDHQIYICVKNINKLSLLTDKREVNKIKIII